MYKVDGFGFWEQVFVAMLRLPEFQHCLQCCGELCDLPSEIKALASALVFKTMFRHGRSPKNLNETPHM